MREHGYNCDLNFIDVSNVTDMSELFSKHEQIGGMRRGTFRYQFIGDISEWNVSHVTNMKSMFAGSCFTGDISNWNVSSVTDMSKMFDDSQFDGDISNWDVSYVTNMEGMFEGSKFNGNIREWNVSKVTNITNMFKNSCFDGDISSWKIAIDCTETTGMFECCNIQVQHRPTLLPIVANGDNIKKHIQKALDVLGNKADLNFIDVTHVTNMKSLFEGSEFNGDISRWDVSNVTDMSGMFEGSEFNDDISNWNVSNVTNMFRMFEGSKFNGDISGWDVSNVTNMASMFKGKYFKGQYNFETGGYEEGFWISNPFNRDISNWKIDIDKTATTEMFESCDIYDEYRPTLLPISANNSNIKTLIQRALGALGNYADLNFIDVSNVTNMESLFEGSEFNGDIFDWDVSNATNMKSMFKNSSFGAAEYGTAFNEGIHEWKISIDKTETTEMFEFCNIPPRHRPRLLDVIASDGNIKTLVHRALSVLGNGANLNFIDVSNVTNMEGLFEGSKFNGDIFDWDVSNVTNTKSMFKNSRFTSNISSWKIDIDKTETAGMFESCNIQSHHRPILPSIIANDNNINTLVQNALEILGSKADLNFIDVSNVTNMERLFEGSEFNGDISKWDVSNVTNMAIMFDDSQFDGDISKWNVSNVTNMEYMFAYSHFDGDISRWNVSSVTNMSGMFAYSYFNGNISNWDVSNVTDMGEMIDWEEKGMFEGSVFNGDISKWDVSNVTSMKNMFKGRYDNEEDYWECNPFDGDISKWNVSNVTDMSGMFAYSGFDGDISEWDVSNVTEAKNMFKECDISIENKPHFINKEGLFKEFKN